MSTLIASRDNDGTGLSHEELVSNATVLFFAGVDTTSTALTYIVYVLGKHPEYFDILEEEVSSHFKEIDEFQSVELEKLPLLNAVIRESLRLYPPAPGPIGRVVPARGAKVAGHNIPAGVTSDSSGSYDRLELHIRRGQLLVILMSTQIQTLSYLIGVVINDDTNRRWLNLTREDEIRLWDHSMIFSYGPRVCLGREYTSLENC
jgi:Cytochrome P450